MKCFVCIRLAGKLALTHTTEHRAMIKFSCHYFSKILSFFFILSHIFSVYFSSYFQFHVFYSLVFSRVSWYSVVIYAKILKFFVWMCDFWCRWGCCCCYWNCHSSSLHHFNLLKCYEGISTRRTNKHTYVHIDTKSPLAWVTSASLEMCQATRLSMQH